MKQKILDVIAEVNKDIILYNGDNLFDAGILDSLQVVNLIAELEDALDIDIDAAYVVEDNFKSLVKEYKVKYLKYFTVDTESQALKIIKDCTSEESFTNYFNENSGTDAGLVTKESSSVDSKIIKKLDKFTKDGIYAKAIKTSESKYAIVWVYNTDKSNLKDEIKESLTSISNFSTKCETSYLRKYNFDVYEPSIKKKIKKSSKDYFE